MHQTEQHSLTNTMHTTNSFPEQKSINNQNSISEKDNHDASLKQLRESSQQSRRKLKSIKSNQITNNLTQSSQNVNETASTKGSNVGNRLSAAEKSPFIQSSSQPNVLETSSKQSRTKTEYSESNKMNMHGQSSRSTHTYKE